MSAERLEGLGRGVLSAVDALDTAPDVSAGAADGAGAPAQDRARVGPAPAGRHAAAARADRARRRPRRACAAAAQPVGRWTLWTLTCALPVPRLRAVRLPARGPRHRSRRCRTCCRHRGAMPVRWLRRARPCRPWCSRSCSLAAVGARCCAAWAGRRAPDPEVAGLVDAARAARAVCCSWCGSPTPTRRCCSCPALHLWLLLAVARAAPAPARRLALVVLGLLPLGLLVAFYAPSARARARRGRLGRRAAARRRPASVSAARCCGASRSAARRRRRCSRSRRGGRQVRCRGGSRRSRSAVRSPTPDRARSGAPSRRCGGERARCPSCRSQAPTRPSWPRTGAAGPAHGSAARCGLLAVLLIIAGALALLDAAVTLVWQEPISALYAELHQDHLSGALRAVERAPPTPPSGTRSRASPTSARGSRSSPRELERHAGDGSAVGRIVIPRIGASFVVVKGTSTEDLEAGPGHLPRDEPSRDRAARRRSPATAPPTSRRSATSTRSLRQPDHPADALRATSPTR